MLTNINAGKFYTLIEINILVNSNYENIHDLFSSIMKSAARLSDAEESCLLLLNKEKKIEKYETASGSGGKVKKHEVKHDEIFYAAQNNESVIINDTGKDNSVKLNSKIKSIMAVPMKIMDDCIGVIQVINKKNDSGFSTEDAEWLEIFANQAALAVNNAVHIEEAQTKIETLEDQIKTDQYHTFISKSPAILEKMEVIEKIAVSDSSVLLLGESGVGKELFAEQIHLKSQRKDKAFVRLNCAAIPEGLLESELFGHVKGAFTNAVANRKGRFELADGGTIFLDEIGDLPMALQVKLLRVIQEKKFEKVGSDVTVTVNVRIIAATNKDLEEQVNRNEFRQDLYYRLNVLPIFIPPLRQRTEDIPDLADFFLKLYMRETKKHFDGFSQESLKTMLSYSWPGNVRELQNCVERACVIGQKKLIEPADLFLKPLGENGLNDSQNGAAERDLKTALNVFKSGFIRKVLDDSNWNQTEAARALAIQRTYLSRLIKELNITPKE